MSFDQAYLFRQGDILTTDWSDADLAYVSSCCFSETVLATLLERMASLKPGAIVLMVKLPEEFDRLFDRIGERRVTMSYGSVIISVLRRK